MTRCNQCTDAPCVAACPTQAMYRREDGIVDFDKSVCIGCKACIAACPYDAIFINPEDNSAEKCNLCAHRLEVGLEPACVMVCPTEAILVGDLNDPGSKVAEIVHREAVTVRRPEKGTGPGVFHKGAHQSTLDPLAARQPDGGLYAWVTQEEPGPGHVAACRPGAACIQRRGAAVLRHPAPRPLGLAGQPVHLDERPGRRGPPGAADPAAGPCIPWGSPLGRWACLSLALAFLAVTGVLLIWDLRHPLRFYLIFTRRHWRKLVGARVLHHRRLWHRRGRVPGLWVATQQVMTAFLIPLALATACYTAYLFAQARARDLWQSPLLASHLAIQAILAGAACLAAPGGGRRGEGKWERITWDEALDAIAARLRTALRLAGVADPACIAALLGAVATEGGTFPNTWNKFVPRPIHVPPHPAVW